MAIRYVLPEWLFVWLCMCYISWPFLVCCLLSRKVHYRSALKLTSAQRARYKSLGAPRANADVRARFNQDVGLIGRTNFTAQQVSCCILGHGFKHYGFLRFLGHLFFLCSKKPLSPQNCSFKLRWLNVRSAKMMTKRRPCPLKNTSHWVLTSRISYAVFSPSLHTKVITSSLTIYELVKLSVPIKSKIRP